MTVFVCKEEVEDIWCGIYDAWMSRLGHKNVRLEPEGRDRELFCEYRQVVTDMEKAAFIGVGNMGRALCGGSGLFLAGHTCAQSV